MTGDKSNRSWKYFPHHIKTMSDINSALSDGVSLVCASHMDGDCLVWMYDTNVDPSCDGVH